MFVKAVFQHCLETLRKIDIQGVEPAVLEPFNQILCEDSSVCTLQPQLSSAFAGCGGKGTKAGVKLHVIEDLRQAKILDIEVTESKSTDAAHGQKIFDFIQSGDLVLRDLGYFSLAWFELIDRNYQAYYLSRLKVNTVLYLEAEGVDRINLPTYLSSIPKSQNTIDQWLYVGARKLHSRLIAYRLPETIAIHRKRVAKRKAQTKGRKLTKEQLTLLEFSFYITNVPKTMWSTEVIGTIYRLRWKIELTFKRWKGLLKLDYLQGTTANRIETILYSRLIAILLLQTLFTITAHRVYHYERRELSPHLFFQWFLINAKSFYLLLINNLKQQVEVLLWSPQLQLLCLQKRKRKTTWEQMEAEVPYLCSFPKRFPFKPLYTI
ncbi:MAG: hypothetical protein COB67_05715 [SAR324 cluster bacterium]|uniref:Transposase IS4-like domain-containing protein n=1 Tax=SAR324 cluster bacterium TaxID=2024889 RepID=A0A2A4T618_9DELT|nr:MAG: hypothetical protein COB67_05715 [SAR324 cluster bacterium]